MDATVRSEDDAPQGRLEELRRARRIGLVLSGGSARCAFQVGVIETLAELGVRPALTLGVSGGAWNAAAVAARNEHRLRYYWRCFVRMPHVDLRNLRTERSPFIYARLHRRTFAEYVGVDNLHRPDAADLWVGVTRLRDRRSFVYRAQGFDDPLDLLLASNYLPPFYSLPPRLHGELYGDGALSDNLPYEKAFAEGCDRVILVAGKGESEGGFFKRPGDADHRVPAALADRTVVVRPRHRLPVSFTERRWPQLELAIEIGRLRAREVLLGERHPETELRGQSRRPGRLLWRTMRAVASRRRAAGGAPPMGS